MKTVSNIELDGPNTRAYRIDAADNIACVSNAWDSFAKDNQGMPSCSFSNLEHKNILSEFADVETRMIYRTIFSKVRSSGYSITFQLHCDSADTIRVLKATVIPLPLNWIEVRFELIEEKRRDPDVVQQLYGDAHGIITMCSYCGDLKDNQGNWQAIETEITKLDLFQQSTLPQISHGICPTCKISFLNSIRKII